MNLLIVESPAKAKTIEKLLGSDFQVKSSYGHIRDLSKEKDAVDVANGFASKYIISPEKYRVVKELKDACAAATEVWLATDEDREGEAISWHLAEVLKLNVHTTKRIVFHEITKPALQKAVQNPRTIDLNLVDAQQARRVLDRLVGFDLSGLLWSKVKGGLSAGRVQSVTVRLVVEREREIMNHTAVSFFKIVGIFSALNEQGKMQNFKAELPARYDKEADAMTFLQRCVGAVFNVHDITVKPTKRSPAPPFTTSTLQQEASRKLYFSPSRTMQVAQKLYEAGFITYMRTDSVNMSETALQAIAAQITTDYGAQYSNTRRYKTKSASAQEAHEAIRPTYFEKQQVSGDRDEQRLYELIWKRAVASQMADAQLEKTTVNIAISTINDAMLRAEGEVIKFDGFLKLYLESTDASEDEDEANPMLPPLKKGQVIDMEQLVAREGFTRASPRYTEASLVKKLEELGIGRPSTYAPTITRIMEEKRGYVVRESRDGVQRNYRVITLKNGTITPVTQTEITGAEKNKLFPTDTGMIVTDFLAKNFGDIMDYNFTATVEQDFDVIADGKLGWQAMLKGFYTPFKTHLEEIRDSAERASGERILGKDPETGLTVLVRMGKYGAVAQLGAPDELDGAKPKYGNLKAGQNIETITFEAALGLFELPKDLGEHNGEMLTIGIGRFGPYIKYAEKKFVSIPKGEDALGVTFERAVEIVSEKERADAPLGTYEGHPFTKGAGKFGPFIKWTTMYISIPKAYNPETITNDEAIILIKAKVEKEGNRYIHNWEDAGIVVENGRWGPFIRYGKLNFKIPKAQHDTAADLTLEQVKAMMLAENPEIFKVVEKKKAAPRKAAAKK
jgi:DNA topoisomerase I